MKIANTIYLYKHSKRRRDALVSCFRAALMYGLCGFVCVGVCPGCIGKFSGDSVQKIPIDYPFAPVSVRVYPLTHISEDPEGLPAVVCHIEFRDAWGESVKAAGELRLSVQMVEGGASAPKKAVEWEAVDLNDLDRNEELYDRATRTYRVQLVDLPEWIREGGERGKSVVVRAEFSMDTSEGEETMTHSLVWDGS